MRGQDSDFALAGGFEVLDPICGTVYSKNLTPDWETGLGGWSDSEIMTAIRSGLNKEGKLLCPTVMPWQAYSKFSDEDTRAIVAYLRAVPAKSHKIPESIPPSGNEAPLQKFRLGDAAE